MMELLNLTGCWCADTDRNDTSRSIRHGTAVIAQPIPNDVLPLGRVLSAGCTRGWLLSYSFSTHMVYARNVARRARAQMMSIDSPLRATAGAACRFSVDSWGLITETERTFDELNNAQVSDEAYVAAFAGVPPSRLSLALGYSEFKPEVKKEVIIPYITEEVSIELPYGVSRVAVMGGVRHVCITSCLSEPSVHLPDSVVSCHIDRGVALAQLSIAPRLARNWSYWSALWGKSYTVPQNFRRTPDGLVTVRLSNEQRLCLA